MSERQTGEMNLRKLTLPGNAIERNFTRFGFCFLIDLDVSSHLTPYSYSRGSDLIKWMAELLIRIKNEYGTKDDFLGHIGGDDFILICSPDRCRYLQQDNRRVRQGIIEHYDPETLKGLYTLIDRNESRLCSAL
jgi:GGDEF domain-containing protein